MTRWVILFLIFVSVFSVQQADAANLVDNGNGTVTDNNTGLIWQQGEPGSMTWGDALSYCKGLSLGGQSDCRLPNIRELKSLTDVTRYNPAIDISFFPHAYASNYWSSTTVAGSPASAWYVYFYSGYVYYISNAKSSSSGYVRCVCGESGASFNLTINKNGSGTGSVTADKGSISWSGNTGTANYSYGSQVTLSANPDVSSLFGWSGGGCSGAGNCTVTLNNNVTVTATFNLKPARIAGSIPTYFTTLQEAHDGASAGNTIEAEGIVFPESLIITKPLTLMGGYDSGYYSISGFTTIMGLIIENGSLTVGNLMVQ